VDHQKKSKENSTKSNNKLSCVGGNFSKNLHIFHFFGRKEKKRKENQIRKPSPGLRELIQ
jgi:hypothetical protein